MKLMRNNRREIINAILERIERKFEDSMALWLGSCEHESEFGTDTESFEVFCIEDGQLEEFNNFIWKLENELASKNGFTILVDPLSKEITLAYREKEYFDELELRAILENISTNYAFAA